ncbi:MAG: hypothetical protein LBP78_00595 [Acidaminococcales bacterium]|nr:hypothetical protein [Acidaminococcales bacterium]
MRDEQTYKIIKEVTDHGGNRHRAALILAKNIEFALDYFDFDSKKGDIYDNNLLWTRVFFYF